MQKSFLKIPNVPQFLIKSSTIAEIGGGQGWASCILKFIYPEKKIITSDISQYAIESVKYWEKLFGMEINQKIVCKSYKIPLENNSVDMIFCFQSAHHFMRHKETLAEIHRILKKEGCAIYMNEPSCKKFIYKLARKRVNKKGPSVPEDVLIYKNIERFSNEIGFEKTNLFFDPTIINRGPMETIYFYLLRQLPVLQHFLPTSIDYIFIK